jgi:hypothetical protein
MNKRTKAWLKKIRQKAKKPRIRVTCPGTWDECSPGRLVAAAEIERRR